MKIHQPIVERQGAGPPSGRLPGARRQATAVKSSRGRGLSGGSRRNSLKSLDQDEGIQGNLGFFLC
jgi:hypothetical protein